MLLNSMSLRSEIVLKGILLDVVILIIDGEILHLLFGGNEMSLLRLLDNIIPGGEELSHLILSVSVVPVGELWSNNEGEVTSLHDGQVETEDILVVEDHTTNPFVVGPSSHS